MSATKLLNILQELESIDAQIQTVLGASDECYEIHNALEDLQELVLEQVRVLQRVN
jgi:hypothetical protein